mmetsp:Transcript_21543/g.19108  ORF Transcript_21543/g.19108 Transcript_21543/m.19108 type:complete len:116 (+) Transcript_21543:787-1134(+)
MNHRDTCTELSINMSEVVMEGDLDITLDYFTTNFKNLNQITISFLNSDNKKYFKKILNTLQGKNLIFSFNQEALSTEATVSSFSIKSDEGVEVLIFVPGSLNTIKAKVDRLSIRT